MSPIRSRYGRKKTELENLYEQIDQQQALNEEMERILSGDSDEVTEWIARDSFGYAAPNERVYYDISGN
jgi:cell division protein DivIC